MNFYKHYIGDFQRDTGHLSLTQRGAYLCLMHHYYATEKPLPNDHAALCRIAGALEKAEREAVRVVMGFFTPVDSGLMHKRIEAEIEKNGRIADVNRDIALAREAKRRATREALAEHDPSTKRAPTVPRTEDEQSTHHSQTPSSSPLSKKRGASAPPLPAPDGVDPAVWSDWLKLRKAKRAPVTGTVVQGAQVEAAKAGMTLEAFLRVWCRRGSQGLEADWLKPHERQAAAPAETAYARQMREKYEQVCPDIAAKRPGAAAPYTVDMEAPDAIAIR